jgi:hypothetical protein
VDTQRWRIVGSKSLDATYKENAHGGGWQRRHGAASELGAEPNALARFLTLGETRVTLRVCEDNSAAATGVVALAVLLLLMLVVVVVVVVVVVGCIKFLTVLWIG